MTDYTYRIETENGVVETDDREFAMYACVSSHRIHTETADHLLKWAESESNE